MCIHIHIVCVCMYVCMCVCACVCVCVCVHTHTWRFLPVILLKCIKPMDALLLCRHEARSHVDRVPHNAELTPTVVMTVVKTAGRTVVMTVVMTAMMTVVKTVGMTGMVSVGMPGFWYRV